MDTDDEEEKLEGGWAIRDRHKTRGTRRIKIGDERSETARDESRFQSISLDTQPYFPLRMCFSD